MNSVGIRSPVEGMAMSADGKQAPNLTPHWLTEVRRGNARGRETKARLTFTTSIFMSRKDHPLLRSLGNTSPAVIYTNYPLITTAGFLKVIIPEGRNRIFHLHPQRLSELVRSSS